MIKKFSIFESEVQSNLQTELTEMIKKSLNTSDSKTVEDFIAAFKKDSGKNQIQGLINNSDIYDFYLKYMDEIDEILNKNKFFDISPKDGNIFSLYKYIIEGTKKAVEFSLNHSSKEETDF